MLVRNGQARPCELERALWIPHRTVMNWQRQLAELGAESFFRARGSRGGKVMTPEVVAACVSLRGIKQSRTQP